MGEILALLGITLVGLALAAFRSRRCLLAGRYTRFAVFEHLVLLWVMFVTFGYAAYFFPNMLGLNGEAFVQLAQYALVFAAALSIILSPLALLLLVILLAPAYLPLPVETHVVILFVLKAMWCLLGASAAGNIVGYVLGHRKRPGLEGTTVA